MMIAKHILNFMIMHVSRGYSITIVTYLLLLCWAGSIGNVSRSPWTVGIVQTLEEEKNR